jgi:hypothetical protein
VLFTLSGFALFENFYLFAFFSARLTLPLVSDAGHYYANHTPIIHPLFTFSFISFKQPITLARPMLYSLDLSACRRFAIIPFC